jgi:hypothetical protein
LIFQSKPPALNVLELTYLPTPTPWSSWWFLTSKSCVAVMLSVPHDVSAGGRTPWYQLQKRLRMADRKNIDLP